MKSKIWLALLALYIVWGSTYLGIKVAIETIPPFFHAGVRFLISGLILVIWQRAAGQSMPTRKQWRSTAIIGSLLLLGGNGLVAWAEQFIPSGIAALIIASVPMFLVIGEAMRPNGIKPNWQGIVGLLIGFVGIFILVGPSEISGSTTKLNPFGVMALLSACLFWAMGSIYSKSADLPKSSLMNTGAQMLMGSISLFIISLISGELIGWDVTAVSARSIYGLSYLIFVGSLVGFVSYGWLLQNAPISLVSTYAYVNPIVAVLLGNWIGNEPLEPRIWVATAIIIGSVIFINSTRPKVNATLPGNARQGKCAPHASAGEREAKEVVDSTS
jgi:drug/metabolite transporter (DMT)-like permease